MPNTDNIQMDVSLVRQLISTQFPEWVNLAIKPVEFSGWDNRTFHLGDDMLVRMPSDAEYALLLVGVRPGPSPFFFILHNYIFVYCYDMIINITSHLFDTNEHKIIQML